MWCRAIHRWNANVVTLPWSLTLPWSITLPRSNSWRLASSVAIGISSISESLMIRKQMRLAVRHGTSLWTQCWWVVAHNSYSHFNLHISHPPSHAFCCILQYSTLSFAVIWCLCGLALTPSCPLWKSTRDSLMRVPPLWKNLEWHIISHPIVWLMHVLYITEQARARRGILRALLFHRISTWRQLTRCKGPQISPGGNSRRLHAHKFGFKTSIASNMLPGVHAVLIGICLIVHFYFAILSDIYAIENGGPIYYI